MIVPAPSSTVSSAALRRLSALAVLDAEAEAAIVAATERSRLIEPRGELLREGTPITVPLLILSGWAARVRQLEDGRRQIMSFLLPGDLIGNCRQDLPLAVSTVTALTELRYCVAPPSERFADLCHAYAVSQALEEAYLLAHITRLGRLNAEERIVDLFLELRERLAMCGLVDGGQMPLPLTQESLADATGLTSVHVNRTLQHLRRRGEIDLRAGQLSIDRPQALAKRVGHGSIRVTLACPTPPAELANASSTDRKAAGLHLGEKSSI